MEFLLCFSPVKNEPTTSPIQNSDIGSNDDSDNDLPSPIKRRRCLPNELSFEKGDLVFAKFKSYPYWPALVSTSGNVYSRLTIVRTCFLLLM